MEDETEKIEIGHVQDHGILPAQSEKHLLREETNHVIEREIAIGMTDEMPLGLAVTATTTITYVTGGMMVKEMREWLHDENETGHVTKTENQMTAVGLLEMNVMVEDIRGLQLAIAKAGTQEMMGKRKTTVERRRRSQRGWTHTFRTNPHLESLEGRPPMVN